MVLSPSDPETGMPSGFLDVFYDNLVNRCNRRIRKKIPFPDKEENMTHFLKFVFVVLLAIGILFVGCSSNQTDSGEAAEEPAQSAPAMTENTVTDVVCGMTVDPEAETTLTSEYEGKTYYFCSEMCKNSFDADPEKYAHNNAGPSDEMPMQE